MRKLTIFLSILLIGSLTACGFISSPTVSPGDVDQAMDALRTEVAQTLEALSTKESAATTVPALPTVEPTQVLPTIEPTQEPLPSSTPLPTATAVILPTAIPATPTATATEAPKPIITIIGVEKDVAVTVRADYFPPNQVFRIRIGPFDNFFKEYEDVGTINSGKGGTFKFTVLLPKKYPDDKRITVRLDSSTGFFAYNYFKNVTSGDIPPVVTPVASTVCEVSISPALSTVMGPGYDFDAVWIVKNISGKTWDLGTIDFKYMRGTKLHKYDSQYDLNEVVKSGEKVEIRVDMLAPLSPGTYSTNWALVRGSNVICDLPLTIKVK